MFDEGVAALAANYLNFALALWHADLLLAGRTIVDLVDLFLLSLIDSLALLVLCLGRRTAELVSDLIRHTKILLIFIISLGYIA